MEMMNRAIEDARDFQEMLKNLEGEYARTPSTRAAVPSPFYAKATRQPGENRQQHRARLRAERKQRA